MIAYIIAAGLLLCVIVLVEAFTRIPDHKSNSLRHWVKIRNKRANRH